MHKNFSGLTLIELVSAMAIVAILAASGTPIFMHLIARYKANSVATSIYQQLQFARNTAMNRGYKVTLCGSEDGEHCTNRSILKILVFKDEDNNHHLDKSDLALQLIDLGLKAQQVRLRAALNRSYIEFDGNGRARQSGSFIYCPKNGDTRNVKRVTISLSGRMYLGRDNNGDGIIERSDGKPISCK